MLLHRARKAAKRHRYAVEAAQPIWGARADRVIADRKALQELLGDHQDSVGAAAFLREIGATEGHNGFTWGVLYAREIAPRETLAQRLGPYLS